MPSTKSYRNLHDKVVSRPGATERLAALREQTVAEVGLHELRRALHQSQTELATTLGLSQSAISQLERGDDVRVSTLRNYVQGLGGELRLVAVFQDGDDETAVPIHIGHGSD